MLAYSTEQAHLYRDGCTGGFRHTGDVVRIKTETGLTSAYTPKHHMVVRMAESMRTEYPPCTSCARAISTGWVCRLFYSGAGQQNGIRKRMHRSGRTPALLSVHDDRRHGPRSGRCSSGSTSLSAVRRGCRSGQHGPVLTSGPRWTTRRRAASARPRALRQAHGVPAAVPRAQPGRQGAGAPSRTAAAAIEGMEVLPEDADFARNGKAPPVEGRGHPGAGAVRRRTRSPSPSTRRTPTSATAWSRTACSGAPPTSSTR